jgi:hypothetical protein
MTGHSITVKLVLLLLVVAALSIALGGDPWGPN